MTDFLKDCYFNGFYKGRKHFVPTPRYAKKLRVLKNILSATPRYATQCEIQVKNFLVDFALCDIAASRFSSSNLIEYLREFEPICKTVLAHESGDPGVYSLTKKCQGSKIS
jgi:hypothetical protein